MKQPHILLVTTDQQRYDATSVTGPSFLRTPHFHQLCDQGVHFSRAYADCPLCVPSRTTIMTGQPAYRHGLTYNGKTGEVIDRETSLPTRLSALGYQTAAIGKMHFEPQRLRHGFQEMILPDDYYREMASSGNELQPMRHGLGQNELTPGMATVPEGKTLTSWIAERCVDYIHYRRDPELPFFLWCSFSKPHPPLDPPEPYYSMYRNCEIPDPVQGDWSQTEKLPLAMRSFWERLGKDRLSPEVIREARAAYYGLITQIDFNLGRILGSLQAADILRDTLILYTSDHGEFLGDHQGCAKTFFNEASARVPFVLRLPPNWNHDHFGKTNDQLVTLADIYPTLLAAAGAERPTEQSGSNLLEALEKDQPTGSHVLSIAGTSDDPIHLAITDGHWKYCYYPEGAVEHLFNLEEDPQETQNRVEHTDAKIALEDLKAALIQKVSKEAPQFLDSCRLPQLPLRGDDERIWRSHVFPGYSTEYRDKDTRH